MDDRRSQEGSAAIKHVFVPVCTCMVHACIHICMLACTHVHAYDDGSDLPICQSRLREHLEI